MTDPALLKRVLLTTAHKPTGATRHIVGDTPLPQPAELRIVKYDCDSGYYLFYCDDSGSEMTDTYHDTVRQAMSQAELEFGIRPEEWLDVEEP